MNGTRTDILAYCKNRGTFRFADLFSRLSTESNITKPALAWHLNGLVEDGHVLKIGRGVYEMRKTGDSSKQAYRPAISPEMKKAYETVSGAFPCVESCVFDGSFLATLQHHISVNRAIYIEVSRDAVEAVFHHLKKEGFVAYLRPDKEFVYDHIDLSSECVIVKPMVSESPLIESDGVKTPRLEKVLVDIFCDDDFEYLHGAESFRIFSNAASLYAINYSTLMRYASRRNAKRTMDSAIKQMNDYD